MSKQIRVSNLPRARDEEVLHWLSLRCAGLSVPKIAKQCGVKGATVERTTRRVLEDDLAMSGEPPDCVSQGYWP